MELDGPSSSTSCSDVKMFELDENGVGGAFGVRIRPLPSNVCGAGVAHVTTAHAC
jgi:hypothetical protein